MSEDALLALCQTALGELDTWRHEGEAESSALQELKKGVAEAASSVDLNSDDEESLVTLLHDMPIAGRIKLALFGGRTIRGLLIRDSNRQIALLVLENASLTEEEVLDFSKNTNLADYVLRGIASRKEWVSQYAVKRALVANPKVPADIGLKLTTSLRTSDLRTLSRSKNIPQVVASQCRRMLDRKNS